MMMKYSKCILVCAVVLSLLNSCLRCRDIEKKEFSSLMEVYFKNYKPGNYFVYFNQDGSKTDSVYVSDFRERTGKDKTVSCKEWDERFFNLNSEYLTNDKSIEVSYTYGDDVTMFGARSKSIDRNFGLVATENSDTLLPSNEIPYVKTISNFQINNGGKHDVTKYKLPNFGMIYFAKNVGIAQYVTNDGVDTFSLAKYFIQ